MHILNIVNMIFFVWKLTDLVCCSPTESKRWHNSSTPSHISIISRFSGNVHKSWMIFNDMMIFSGDNFRIDMRISDPFSKFFINIWLPLPINSTGNLHFLSALYKSCNKSKIIEISFTSWSVFWEIAVRNDPIKYLGISCKHNLAANSALTSPIYSYLEQNLQ